MAKVANGNREFTDKVKMFLSYLMKIKHISHMSIGRAIRVKSNYRIKRMKLGHVSLMKVVIAYSNNYKEWCELNGYVVENEVVDRLNKLYG